MGLLRSKSGCLLLLLAAACSSEDQQNGNPSQSAGLPLNTICPTEFKWSDIPSSPDTQNIYLSSSDGFDGNTCLSPEAPCQTPAAAIEKLRNGFPDHLLIKRGDIFTGSLSLGFKTSGRSKEEPLVIATYGDHPDRPVFFTGHSGAFHSSIFEPLSHVWLMDLVFEANDRNPYLSTYNPSLNEAATGISFMALQKPIEDILVEGVEVRFFNGGFVSHSADDIPITDIRLRGNSFHTQWSITGGEHHQGHSEGLYTNNINGLFLEGNVFEGNGGLYNYPGDPRLIVPDGLTQENITITWFNHQIYSDAQNQNVKLCGNIFANGDGVQLRSGGVAIDNIFVRTVNALTGGGDDGMTENSGYAFHIENNLFMEGTDFPEESATPGPRGNGISFINASNEGATIRQNLFLRDVSAAGYGTAIFLSGQDCTGSSGSFSCAIRKARIEENQIIDWRGGIQLRGTAGSELQDIQISNNLVAQMTSSDAMLTNISETTPNTAVVWDDNQYYSARADGRWFGIDSVTQSFVEWQAAVGDSNSHQKAPTIVQPNLKFEEVVNGNGSTYLDAFARLHQQRRWDYDPALYPTELIRAVRDQLDIQE